MQEKTGATVDVSDDGTVSVFGQNQTSMQECLAIIEGILEEPELNKVYKGTVVKIVDFGAFVNILPGKDGLLHISEISAERISSIMTSICTACELTAAVHVISPTVLKRTVVSNGISSASLFKCSESAQSIPSR